MGSGGVAAAYQEALNMDHFTGKPWNSSAAVPMASWLCHKRSAEDEARFKMMGNVVIPQGFRFRVPGYDCFDRRAACILRVDPS